MKTIQAILLTVLFILYLLSQTVYAAPTLTCDDQAGVNLYKFQDMPAPLPANTTSVTAGGALLLDMATSPTGTFTIRASACKTDPIWGEACSVWSVPFTYTRPAPPVVPANIRLVAP